MGKSQWSSSELKKLTPAMTFACSMAGGLTGWMPIHPFDVLKTQWWGC
eukprot:gene11247-33595_t